MTLTTIEKLEESLTLYEMDMSAAAYDDLHAIIVQHKRESGEDQPVCTMLAKDGFVWSTVWRVPFEDGKHFLYTSPQPSHKKLISELVEALDDANRKLRKAKDFENQAEMYISESAYELDGFLGTTAADISVNWQKSIDANNTLLTKAREVVKHE